MLDVAMKISGISNTREGDVELAVSEDFTLEKGQPNVIECLALTFVDGATKRQPARKLVTLDRNRRITVVRNQVNAGDLHLGAGMAAGQNHSAEVRVFNPRDNTSGAVAHASVRVEVSDENDRGANFQNQTMRW